MNSSGVCMHSCRLLHTVYLERVYRGGVDELDDWVLRQDKQRRTRARIFASLLSFVVIHRDSVADIV